MQTYGEKKLILHVDIRNTVLLLDSVKPQMASDAALQRFFSTVSWGEVTSDGEWSLGHTTTSLTRPHPHLISYYKFQEEKLFSSSSPPSYERRGEINLATSHFVTSGPGAAFREKYEECVSKLPKEDGILSSFYRLLDFLSSGTREWAVVFRTCGIDCNKVLSELATGVKNIQILPHIDRLRREKDKMRLELSGDVVLNEELSILRNIEARVGISGIQDDYFYWSDHNFVGSAGKPLWLEEHGDCHHIIFDDNVRPWDSDSIVDFRIITEDGNFASLSDEESIQLENVNWVQCDLLHAILDENYFIDALNRCEWNLSGVNGVDS